jgi:hypothetical protein
MKLASSHLLEVFYKNNQMKPLHHHCAAPAESPQSGLRAASRPTPLVQVLVPCLRAPRDTSTSLHSQEPVQHKHGRIWLPQCMLSRLPKRTARDEALLTTNLQSQVCKTWSPNEYAMASHPVNINNPTATSILLPKKRDGACSC